MDVLLEVLPRETIRVLRKVFAIGVLISVGSLVASMIGILFDYNPSGVITYHNSGIIFGLIQRWLNFMPFTLIDLYDIQPIRDQLSHVKYHDMGIPAHELKDSLLEIFKNNPDYDFTISLGINATLQEYVPMFVENDLLLSSQSWLFPFPSWRLPYSHKAEAFLALSRDTDHIPNNVIFTRFSLTDIPLISFHILRSIVTIFLVPIRLLCLISFPVTNQPDESLRVAILRFSHSWIYSSEKRISNHIVTCFYISIIAYILSIFSVQSLPYIYIGMILNTFGSALGLMVSHYYITPLLHHFDQDNPGDAAMTSLSSTTGLTRRSVTACSNYAYFSQLHAYITFYKCINTLIDPLTQHGCPPEELYTKLTAILHDSSHPLSIALFNVQSMHETAVSAAATHASHIRPLSRHTLFCRKNAKQRTKPLQSNTSSIPSSSSSSSSKRSSSRYSSSHHHHSSSSSNNNNNNNNTNNNNTNSNNPNDVFNTMILQHRRQHDQARTSRSVSRHGQHHHKPATILDEADNDDRLSCFRGGSVTPDNNTNTNNSVTSHNNVNNAIPSSSLASHHHQSRRLSGSSHRDSSDDDIRPSTLPTDSTGSLRKRRTSLGRAATTHQHQYSDDEDSNTTPTPPIDDTTSHYTPTRRLSASLPSPSMNHGSTTTYQTEPLHHNSTNSPSSSSSSSSSTPVTTTAPVPYAPLPYAISSLLPPELRSISYMILKHPHLLLPPYYQPRPYSNQQSNIMEGLSSPSSHHHTHNTHPSSSSSFYDSSDSDDTSSSQYTANEIYNRHRNAVPIQYPPSQIMLQSSDSKHTPLLFRPRSFPTTSREIRDYILYNIKLTDECLICRIPFNQDSIISILPCGHTFHPSCSTTWLLRKARCPYCTQPLHDQTDIIKMNEWNICQHLFKDEIDLFSTTFSFFLSRLNSREYCTLMNDCQIDNANNTNYHSLLVTSLYQQRQNTYQSRYNNSINHNQQQQQQQHQQHTQLPLEQASSSSSHNTTDIPSSQQQQQQQQPPLIPDHIRINYDKLYHLVDSQITLTSVRQQLAQGLALHDLLQVSTTLGQLYTNLASLDPHSQPYSSPSQQQQPVTRGNTIHHA